VLLAELSEHAPDGLRLGGYLDPFHLSAAARTSADVDLPDVTQEERPGPSLAVAYRGVAVLEPESKLAISVVEQWILDCRRRLWHNFSAQR
jgi:hypothetical protein